jgi:hypothetical protein
MVIRDPEAPATRSQLRYARNLGIDVPDGITKGEISQKIEEVVSQQEPEPASEAQLKFAQSLGLEFESGITKTEMKRLLNKEVPRISRYLLKHNSALQAGKVIFYDGATYIIKFIGQISRRYVADLVPYLGGPTKRVMVVSLKDVAEVDASQLPRRQASD